MMFGFVRQLCLLRLVYGNPKTDILYLNQLCMGMHKCADVLQTSAVFWQCWAPCLKPDPAPA